MFRIPTGAAAAVLIPLITATPASADSFSRTGPNGGSVTSNWSYGGGNASGTVSRTGPNGGTSSATTNCTTNGVDRCRRDFSYTNPSGETWSGSAGAAAGPYRGRSYGRVTSPSGETYYGARSWRR